MKASKWILFGLLPIIGLVCAVFAQVATEQIWPPNIRDCEHCEDGVHWINEKESHDCKFCEGAGAVAVSSVEPWVLLTFFFAFFVPCVLCAGVLTGAWRFEFFNVKIIKNNTVKIEHERHKDEQK